MKILDLRSVAAFVFLLPLALPAEGQSSSQGGLDEITVTAQRREQSLQDAAVALDVIDAEKLIRSGLESGRDLGQISPSLGIAAGGGPITSLFIRGVGANTVNPLIDAGVSQNYDGLYLGRPAAAAGLGFYDMERIEVLKGPQGTLYGRNATGGVVNYIPVKPSIGETNGYAQLEVGNYGKIGAQGAMNIAVGDAAALRLSGNFLERDAFADDGTNDAESYSLRVQYLADISDNASLRIAADHSDVSSRGLNGDLVGIYNNNAFAGPLTDFTPSGLPVDSGAASDAANALNSTVLAAPAFAFLDPIDPSELFQDLTFTGILAELNYETDNGTLTFIPAYREADLAYAFVGPRFGPAPSQETHEQFTAELRYATDLDGSFNAVMGAFYFDEEVGFSANFNQDYVGPVQNFTNGGDSFAIFAQGTFDISDTFRLNAGVRYTDDHKFVSGTNHTFVLFCGGPPGGGFLTPPASFGAGCQNQMSFPAISDPDAFIQYLVDAGMIPPGSTPQDGFYPVINGIPGAIIDVEGPGGLTLTNTVDDDEVTYRFGVELDVGADSLLYAGYERGYRAGGVDVSQIEPTYPAEYIDAITIGSKNRFMDNRVQLNLEAFYWEYEDQQINYFATIDGAPSFPTASAASTIQGLDVDLVWAAGDATTIGIKAQFLDSTFDQLELLADPGSGRFGCTSNGVVGAYESFDCAGQNLVYSPEFALDLSINHIFDLGDFELYGALDVIHRGDQITDTSFLPETLADSHTMLNLALTLVPADGAWSVTAYGRNMTDERFLVSTSVSRFGPLHGVSNNPATYGVRFGMEF